MSEQRATHTTATQQAASDEKAQQVALTAPTSTLSFVLMALVFVVVVLLLAALAQEMGEERAADVAPSKHPAADQKAQYPAMIFIFALILIVVHVLVFALIFLLVVLAQEVGKQQAADAASTQQTTGNQELQETMLLIASFVALSAKLVAFLSATALTKQARKKQAPCTLAAQTAC